MNTLRLFRGFAYRNFEDIFIKGLSIPNPDNWNWYKQSDWPSNMVSFASDSEPNRNSVIESESLAKLITRKASFENILLSPFVAILYISDDLITQMRDGILGVIRNRPDGEKQAIWEPVSTVSQANQYNEFLIGAQYLTPDWLIKFRAEIGAGLFSEERFIYREFSSLKKGIEHSKKWLRK